MVKLSPELYVDVSVTCPELSFAVGFVQLTTAEAKFWPVLTLISDGKSMMTGFSTSMENRQYTNVNVFYYKII